MSVPMNENTDTRLDLNDIRQRLQAKEGKAYWQSLDELANTSEFQEFMFKEFPRQAAPLENSLNRRDFVKLLGASLALAGLTACANPPANQQVVPYVEQPEAIVPGEPLFFATALTHGGFARGVLAESNMGRPTKIEGNPDHPASLGATDPTMQASVLTLYDPDRSQTVLRDGELSTWEDFGAALTETLAGLESGQGLRLLTETVTSPTLAGQIQALLERYPDAQWHQYEPLSSDNVREGALLAFGEDVRPRYNFAEANIIFSLGADFLGSGPASVRYSREFSNRRRVRVAEDGMNRLYAAESTTTITGTMADHRLPLRPADLEALARVVAKELGVSVEGELPESVPAEWVAALVSDLDSNRGSSLVIAGEEQPPVVQALAHAINDALGNVGKTLIYHAPVEAQSVAQLESLQNLVSDMNAGEVQALIILGSNPVYNAPVDLAFAEALGKVPFSVRLGLYEDETSLLTSWHLPQTHELETWSDARAFEGTTTIMQPLIAPFYNGRSVHEVLAALMGNLAAVGYDIIRESWQARASGDFDAFWRDTVYRGTVAESSLEPIQVSFNGTLPAPEDVAQADTLDILFRPDPYIGAGHYSNNGWLQELPKPITKLTWGNAAMIGPSTAERLGVTTNDVVTLTLEGRNLNAPVWVLPGQADNVVTLHLGYGRERVGNIGNGVGVDANKLRSAASVWQANGLTLSKTGERYNLVSTQMHHTIDTDGIENRHIIRSGTIEEFRAEPEHPHFVHPIEHHESDLYPDYEYEGYAWGMVIDQNVCTGCSACVVACQSENNVPIVGIEQVSVGREMHWLRIDSYYAGDLDNPEVYYQPMLCQMCEKAPCEVVCPVGATVHDHEGLNVMVYNRCVGTRYCSNNCPYKVRRFNFLQYAELEENALTMVQNPEVTVRSRGVMEKCTYCTQRISSARIRANNEDREIRDGEVVTACQAACPTQAIIFGDINDAGSRVSEDKTSPLNYALLEELNTVPRTSYLAKLNNPNPALTVASAAAHEETGSN